jgi:twitching motility protein PilT
MFPVIEIDSTLAKYLETVWEVGASDLLLVDKSRPLLRIDGLLNPMEDAPEMEADQIDRMVRSMLRLEHREILERSRQVDFSFTWKGHGRFRGNAYRTKGTTAVALRAIPDRIPQLEELGCPDGIRKLLGLPYGLVLVVGPTGSGKSTTLAAMVDRINSYRPCHILTIEDPVEYIHHHQRAAVSQREVGEDVPTFSAGLRAALREDPDVILVGEMRDTDSISITLSLAETGHLVFATLHTNDASQALDRVVDVFPAERRDQIQVQLAATLQGVISQRLLPVIGGGRVAAFEVLMATEAVRNLVREGKTRQLRNVITTSRIDGMQTLENDLTRLVASGLITREMAESITLYPKDILAQGPVPGYAQQVGALAAPVPVPSHIR